MLLFIIFVIKIVLYLRLGHQEKWYSVINAVLESA